MWRWEPNPVRTWDNGIHLISRPWSRGFRFGFFVFVNVAAIAGLIIFERGHQQDINWDLLNYHYYNAYSFFHHRLQFDVMPASIQGYFNPLLNLPSYIFINHLRPSLVRPALTVLDGVAFGAVFWATSAMVGSTFVDIRRYTLATSAGIVALFGPTFLSTTGTSFVDDFSIVPILGAVGLLFARQQAFDPRARHRDVIVAFFGSALLIGVATGLKLTNAVFAIGYAAAVVATLPFAQTHPLAPHQSALQRWVLVGQRLALCAVGGGLGVLISGGWWGLRLFRRFGSPVFPYVNTVFHSPYFPPVALIDKQHLPVSLYDIIVAPLTWVVLGEPVKPTGGPESDTLLSLTLIAILVFFIFKFFTSVVQHAPNGGVVVRGVTGHIPHASRPRMREARASQEASGPLDPRVRGDDDEKTVESRVTWNRRLVFLLVFFLSSFYIWIVAFGIRRYAVPLDAVAPLLLIAIVHAVCPSRWALPAWGAVVVLAVLTCRPEFSREAPPGRSYFQTEELAAPYQGTGTTFLMTSGSEPVSYLIPAFSPDNRFIRLGGDLPIDPPSPFDAIIRRDLDTAPGPLKSISTMPIIDRVALGHFGLTLTGRCTAGRTVADQIHICDLERAPPGPDMAAAPLRLGERIDFRDGGNGWVYEADVSCWSWSEDWGVYATDGAPWCSMFLFRLTGLPNSDVTLDVLAHAFLPTDAKQGGADQTVTVTINNAALGDWTFSDSAPVLRTATIPRALLGSGTNILRFRAAHPLSPHEAGTNPTDNRKLAIGLHWLTLRE